MNLIQSNTLRVSGFFERLAQIQTDTILPSVKELLVCKQFLGLDPNMFDVRV